MTFAETFETHRRSFVDSLRILNYSPSSLNHRSAALDTFFRFLCTHGIDDVREVSEETIRDYQLFLLEPQSIRHGKQECFERYTILTVHSKLMGVRKFFEHLEKMDVILVNPCAKMLLPKMGESLPPPTLTQEEAKAILEAPDMQTQKGIRDKAILELFYSTGIRLEEMAKLLVQDVDLRAGLVRVNKGKFARDRVVPMGQKASEAVKEYLVTVRSRWSRSKQDERALWLVSVAPHRPLKSQVIAIYVREYGRAAGVGKRVTPHLWRHTCATHMLANGSNIAHVQRLLGHRSLATTQIYTRAAIPEIKETFARTHPRGKKRS